VKELLEAARQVAEARRQKKPAPVPPAASTPAAAAAASHQPQPAPLKQRPRQHCWQPQPQQQRQHPCSMKQEAAVDYEALVEQEEEADEEGWQRVKGKGKHKGKLPPPGRHVAAAASTPQEPQRASQPAAPRLVASLQTSTCTPNTCAPCLLHACVAELNVNCVRLQEQLLITSRTLLFPSTQVHSRPAVRA
jgi:hypothetical protein